MPAKKRPAPSAAPGGGTTHEEDEAFPRGGGDVLTPLERRQVEEEARAEVERELRTGGTKRVKQQSSAAKGGKKKGKAAGSDDEDGEEAAAFNREALQGSVSKYVELLKFKNLSVGMKVWGIVLEVSQRGVTVSLPHGLRGHVAPSEASEALAKPSKSSKGAKGGDEPADAAPAAPALTDLFHVGQYVRAVVTKLEAGEEGGKGEEAEGPRRKHVELSLRLKKLHAGCEASGLLAAGNALPACVSSEQDHGWTLNLGLKGAVGFLKRKDHEAAFGAGAALQKGAMLEVVVRGPADARGVVPVSSDPESVSSAVTREVEGLALGGLLPGALVNCKVRTVLSDGLVVSFLTFFHGTVDPFHLGVTAQLGAGGWKGAFSEGQKLKARILYVNPSTKAVGLSLLPHLMGLTLPSPTPMLGQVFESAPILRVDKGLGLMVKLPLGEQQAGEACLGYCHISNVSDERVSVLEASKGFKEGAPLRCRVTGFRLVDGLATVSAKTSVVEQQVLSVRDVYPGMPLTATVQSVDGGPGGGLLLAVTPTLRAAVPLIHMSDLGKASARAKFKVGQKVTGRVLAVDVANRRVSMTLKPSLCGSKLPVIASPQNAVPGVRAHGVVSGIKDYGVFVTFYGGVSGLAHASELGLPEGGKPADVYSVGQVVKARVTAIEPSTGRVRLSLKGKAPAAGAAADEAAAGPAAAAAAADACGGLQPGDVVRCAVVQSVQEVPAAAGAAGRPGSIVIHVLVQPHAAGAAADGEEEALLFAADPALRAAAAAAVSVGAAGVSARLEVSHLSDHPAAVAALKEALQPGAKLGPLVVLERLEGSKAVRLSRKASLVTAAAAGALPKAFADVREASLLPGYVANVTPDAVFVRFAGSITGRAGLSQLADTFVSDPRSHFSEGQSVRAQVVSVDGDKQRFNLTLKPSLTSSATDASFLTALLRDLEVAERLKASASTADASDRVDWSRLPVGGLAAGSVHEVAEYGVLCDLEAHADIVGVIRNEQLPAASASALRAPGAPVAAVVLDVDPGANIVDLSAKDYLVEAAKQRQSASAPPPSAKKGKKQAAPAAAAAAQALPQVGTSLEGVVECVKESVVVISLPSAGHALAVAARTDFNTQVVEHVKRRFEVGQRVVATVQAAPSGATGGRLVAAVALTRTFDGAADGTPGGAKPKVEPGARVQALVTSVHPTQVDVALGRKLTGRIHITEAADLPAPQQLLQQIQEHQAAAAAGGAGGGKRARKGASGAGGASAAAGAGADVPPPPVLPASNVLEGFRVQQTVDAVVLGRLGAAVGRGGHAGHGTLELSTRSTVLAAAGKGASALPAPVTFSSLSSGDLVSGVVVEVGEDHLWVALSPCVRGRVHVLEASNEPAHLAAFASTFGPGQLVVARVLEVNGKKGTLDLSLRLEASRGSSSAPSTAPGSSKKRGRAEVEAAAAAVAAAGEGEVLMGRVAAVSGAGVKVHLSGRRSGRVALTDIHDTWVPNALEGLAEGTYVRARVLGPDPAAAAAAGSSGKGEAAQRLLLSLRPSRGGAVAGLPAPPADASPAPELLPAASRAEGGAVSAYVKRSDAKGVFLVVDRACEGRIKLSNLSDGFIEDPAAAFPAGARVEGRVVSVGEGGRLEVSLRSAAAASSGWRSAKDLVVGEVVSGRVRRVEKYGVFVELAGSSVVGLAHISELADGKVKDINGLFRAKQAVKAKVLKVDEETGKVSLGLKPSYFADGEGEDGEEGGAAAGGKRAPRQRGKGAAAAAAASADIDAEMADAEEEEEGDDGVDSEGEEDEDEEVQGLGLDSEDDDVSQEGDDDEDEDEDAGDMDVDAIGAESSEEEEDEDEDDEDEEGEEEEEGSSEEEEEAAGTIPGTASIAATLLQGGAVPDAPTWGGLQLVDGDGADGDEEGAAAGGKAASKGAKKRAKEERERQIREAELARLRGGSEPTTPAEYEAAVMGAPNSSVTWIRYMACLLGLGEVEQARAVAERALKTINYRDEGEKFNVWVALLNLEAAYGGPAAGAAGGDKAGESLMSTFSRAAQYCDQKKLYFALMGILDRHDMAELAESTLKTMCKKFGGSAKVWLRAIEACLKRGDGEGARKTLERATTALPQRKHIKVITQSALMEFRTGSAERGRGIFEGLVRNYPRRLDLWGQYLDQEVKAGDAPRCRSLFERATSLSLPPKKMKVLFKRWLEWERGLPGDNTAQVDHVKRRAMEFVESAMKA